MPHKMQKNTFYKHISIFSLKQYKKEKQKPSKNKQTNKTKKNILKKNE